MSVAVVPSPQDSEQLHAKPLKLVWQDWRTSSKYFTGSADSHMHSLSLKYAHAYAPARGEIRLEAEAFAGR
jgi:hypothetical protein